MKKETGDIYLLKSTNERFSLNKEEAPYSPSSENRIKNDTQKVINKALISAYCDSNPRSMIRVMRDIDLAICLNRDKDIILTDISQLKAQLSAVENTVNKDDYKKARKILNPHHLK